ncbi:MAG: hypothetical protein MJ236_02785 [Clostridia bacterium]|nr:hypothetical protein [Clostridia bacterium]
MENINYSVVSRGTRGIFADIEKNANRFSSICLIMLAAVAIILISVASIVDHSEYMHEVRIAIGLLILISLSTGIYSLVRKKQTSARKYVLCYAWLVSVMLAVSFVDSSVVLLYAIPVLLAVRYNSVIYTLFVSVFNIIFAFFPYLIYTYRGSFPLDFIMLQPGTVITITESSLDGSVNALIDQILRTETISNMLSYGYLAVALFLVIISVIAVSFTAYNRKLILDQYKRARSQMEV